MENNTLTNINMENSTPTQNSSINYPSPKKTRGSAAKVIALALCCSLVGGACGAGGMAVLGAFKNNTDITAGQTEDGSTLLVGKRDGKAINLSYVDTEKELTAAEIYAANVNSTVGITTQITTNYFGYKTQAAASGSGFILTSDGYIVTNYHVVESADEIKVTTYDNKTYKAELIGYDESNDIAVLKVDADDLTPVVLGDSEQMNVGDSVVAIGNPLGELTFSLTSGSVSALNRKITINNTAMNLIQTDCAINSGNSGGALFNSHGEVIGITNAKYSGSGDSSSASIDNIGFAIPINSVRDIITSIIEKGYIEKPYIGITVYDAVSDYKGKELQGAVVHSVEKDSPADKAGLQEDDIITAVNGEKISGTTDLVTILAQGEEGDKYTLTVYRDGETIEVKVKLAVRQQSALPDDNTVEGSKREGGSQNYPYQDVPGNDGQGSNGFDPFDGNNPFGDGNNFPYGDGQDLFGNGDGNHFPYGNNGGDYTEG